MIKEEILTIEQLRESLFENRYNRISLIGIQEYFKRNNIHYSLEEVFEVNATLLGSLQLYHDKKTSLNSSS